MSAATLHEAFAQLLQNSSVAGFSWGKSANPYYEEAPEPSGGTPLPFPIVVYEIPDSQMTDYFERAYQEKYQVTVKITAQESQVATLVSPYATTSLLYYLDSKRDTPSVLNGANFLCNEFLRNGWKLSKVDVRGPAGDRIWLAEATYEIQVSFSLLG
jgi:hypothetical protein